ncbi:MAG TPA: dihydropyrimidinase [Nitrososphaerales archaeon]|nr:dihydropyrimidinase [Nitrososphaerales archaeon]
MDLLVKNARIITGSESFESNIGVEGGKIASLSPILEPSGERAYDARGKIVIPGGIDAHTHMELQVTGTKSADDFYSGTVAAACGGISTIIDFVDALPGQSLLGALAEYRRKADRKVAVDYGLHMMLKGQNLPEISKIPEVISKGVPSFKVYTAYRKRGLMLEDTDISRVMEKVAGAGGLVAVHAESESIIQSLIEKNLAAGNTDARYHALSRPASAEAEAISRVARLAKAASARIYIVHLSSRAGKEEVEDARRRGTNVFAETCPHYLVLTDKVYEREDGRNFVMSPALKTPEDQAALWEGLAPGGVIETVGSDHCPFTGAEKDWGEGDFTKIPNGVPGTEAIIPLLYSEGVRKGRISMLDLVRVTSGAPAMRFGLSPSKGSISVGSDADLVVIDPSKRVRMTADAMHSKIDYSIYDRITTEGYPVLTVSRGEIVMEDGEFVGSRGRGRFVPRRAAS